MKMKRKRDANGPKSGKNEIITELLWAQSNSVILTPRCQKCIIILTVLKEHSFMAY